MSPKKVQKAGLPKSKLSSLLALMHLTAGTFRHGDLLVDNDDNIYRLM
jgi:hypothetical protein